MGQQTAIGYVDHTWTGIRGCKHATLPDGTPHPGCDHCFAEAQANRNPATLGTWGEGGTRVRGADSYWKLPLKWNRAAEDRCESTNGHGDRCTKRAGHKGTHHCFRPTGPMGWGDDEPRPKQARVLWDLGDLFEDWPGPVLDHKGRELWTTGQGTYMPRDNAATQITSEHRMATMSDLRRDAFGVFDQTPNLIWMVPTKRPWNVRGMWPEDNFAHGLDGACRDNVWLGVSVSDQKTADALIPELLTLRDLVPVLFVSIEPLLGPIDLTGWFWGKETCCGDCPRDIDCEHGMERRRDIPGESALDWVIVGGESGGKARGCDVDWIRSLVQQSDDAGVPCYVKQVGAKPFERQGSISNWPTGTRVEFDNDDTIIRIDLKHKKGADDAEWPDDLKVRQVPQPAVAA